MHTPTPKAVIQTSSRKGSGLDTAAVNSPAQGSTFAKGRDFPWPTNYTLIDFSNGSDVPVFEPDKKRTWSAGPMAFDVRTRVEIDATSGAAAKSQLFTQRLVSPIDDQSQPHVWRGRLELPGFDPGGGDDALLDLCLEALNAGLPSIGKTSAMTVSPTIKPCASRRVALGNPVRVCLVTPCLMLREYHLSEPAQYHDAIREYWRKASGGAAELADETGLDGRTYPAVFAQLEYRHSFAATRYPMYGAASREPFVLTKPGSVFVLDVTEPAAFELKLAGWLNSRLPAARWGDATNTSLAWLSSADWNECPYLPENGYGEIALVGEDDA